MTEIDARMHADFLEQFQKQLKAEGVFPVMAWSLSAVIHDLRVFASKTEKKRHWRAFWCGFFGIVYRPRLDAMAAYARQDHREGKTLPFPPDETSPRI